jgi:hypothetical protein
MRSGGKSRQTGRPSSPLSGFQPSPAGSERIAAHSPSPLLLPNLVVPIKLARQGLCSVPERQVSKVELRFIFHFTRLGSIGVDPVT